MKFWPTRDFFVLSSLYALVLIGVSACAELEPEDAGSPETELPATQPTLELAREPGDSSLCCGTKRTLVEGIVAAENLLITSDERLLVTGDEGIFQVVPASDGSFTAAVLEPASDCSFGGIAEAAGAIYVNCYNFADSYLYASALTTSPSFRRIATFPGVLLANGLTADEMGHLYLATTFQDQILRVRFAPADRFTPTEIAPWLSSSGLFTNGMEHFGGAIYWTDATSIKKAQISAGGRAGPVRTLASRLTFFDDLFVDDQGILVADYLESAIRAYTLEGRSTGATAVELANPSAVVAARGRAGFSQKALIVCEKSADRVVVIEPQ